MDYRTRLLSVVVALAVVAADGAAAVDGQLRRAGLLVVAAGEFVVVAVEPADLAPRAATLVVVAVRVDESGAWSELDEWFSGSGGRR